MGAIAKHGFLLCWHFRHEADYVDYATLDITFRESGEPQKIFVFENQFLMEIENPTRK
ncbi:hypothetical protein [Kingella kingae]|uniref:hypothetical protein n=1 Tax=Kingella kingae TaxID=504 RepID=UPI001E5154EF|nr:hypothetical protein [Kingella kingae]